ncbi:hypothetical protein H0H93_007507, partial [Arthromyces matolae]
LKKKSSASTISIDMRSVFLAPTFFLASSWLAMQAYSAPVESAAHPAPPSTAAITDNSAPQPVPVNPVALRAHVNKSGYQSPSQLTPVQENSLESENFQSFLNETCYKVEFAYCYKNTNTVEQRHCCWQAADEKCKCEGKNPYDCPVVDYKRPSPLPTPNAAARHKSTE